MTEYKPTLFDRHGPAALDRVRIVAYAAMVFGLTFGALALYLGFSIWTFAGSLIAAVLAGAATQFFTDAVGDAATTLATGGGTSSATDFSYQAALVMQGRVDEALASFEALIASSPTAIEPRVRAADLYSRDPARARRAADLLREAQRIPGIAPGRDTYVTNRLVDLLTGPLADPGRALVELRRLIERYPTSKAASHARDAIARLKSLG
ncbi:MAG TPA: hypothetical protein VJN70_05340 [Gemmatimonadaceae bacterium]|nr:hypothetical protein [Gemmatimonadaceae bacterium]